MKYNSIHHIAKRKRKSANLAPYPHPNRWLKFLDRTVLGLAVIGPLMSIPQIYEIYVYRNATGVSALSWGLLALTSIPWLIYGFIHKEPPIIVSSALWILANMIVVIGVLLYS